MLLQALRGWDARVKACTSSYYVFLGFRSVMLVGCMVANLGIAVGTAHWRTL